MIRKSAVSTKLFLALIILLGSFAIAIAQKPGTIPARQLDIHARMIKVGLVANLNKDPSDPAGLRVATWEDGDRIQIMDRDANTTLVYDSASTATDDDGITFDPDGVPGTAGRFIREFKGPVHVKWFGAIGDGVADDTAAMSAAVNAAMTANKPLQLTDGATYLVDTVGVAIQLPVGSLRIEGGEGSTIQGNVATSTDLFEMQDGNSVVFDKVSFDRLENILKPALATDTYDKIEFRNCTFNDFNDSVYFIPTGGTMTGVAATFANATELFTSAGHALSNGNRVTLSGTVPTGYNTTFTYHVVGVSGDDFQLSLTAGGAPVDGSDDGSSITFQSDWSCTNYVAINNTVTNGRRFSCAAHNLDSAIVTENTISTMTGSGTKGIEVGKVVGSGGNAKSIVIANNSVEGVNGSGADVFGIMAVGVTAVVQGNTIENVTGDATDCEGAYFKCTNLNFSGNALTDAGYEEGMLTIKTGDDDTGAKIVEGNIFICNDAHRSRIVRAVGIRTSNVRVSDNRFSGFVRAVEAIGGSEEIYDNVQVVNNTIKDGIAYVLNGDCYQIYCRGEFRNLQIRDNTILDLGDGTNSQLTYAIHVWADDKTAAAGLIFDGLKITGNTVNNITSNTDARRRAVNFSGSMADFDNVVIEQNDFDNVYYGFYVNSGATATNAWRIGTNRVTNATFGPWFFSGDNLLSVVRPEDYEAKGDGVTDDTAAMSAAVAAAMTAGKPLQLTDGATYDLATWTREDTTANLTVDAGTAIITGTSSIEFLGVTAGHTVKWTGGVFDTWDNAILVLTGSNHETIEFVGTTFTNCDRGINDTGSVVNVARLIVRNCTFSSCSEYGVLGRSTYGYAEVSGSNFTAIGGTAVSPSAINLGPLTGDAPHGEMVVSRNTINGVTCADETLDTHGIIVFGRNINIDRNHVENVWAADPATFANATEIWTETAHGLFNGNRVLLKTSGALPAGYVATYNYFVVGSTANTFQLSLTSGGAAVNGTDDGTGNHFANVGGTDDEAIYGKIYHSSITNNTVHNAGYGEGCIILKSDSKEDAYSAGTVTSSGTTVTLTGGTWPTWVGATSQIFVNGVASSVASRTSGSIIELLTAPVVAYSTSSYQIDNDLYGGFSNLVEGNSVTFDRTDSPGPAAGITAQSSHAMVRNNRIQGVPRGVVVSRDWCEVVGNELNINNVNPATTNIGIDLSNASNSKIDGNRLADIGWLGATGAHYGIRLTGDCSNVNIVNNTGRLVGKTLYFVRLEPGSAKTIDQVIIANNHIQEADYCCWWDDTGTIGDIVFGSNIFNSVSFANFVNATTAQYVSVSGKYQGTPNAYKLNNASYTHGIPGMDHFCDSAAAAIAVTLPSGTFDGQTSTFRATDITNAITITANSIAHPLVAVGQSIELQWDGVAWNVVYAYASHLNLSSAGTVNIGAAPVSVINITGTTTINLFDTVPRGTIRYLTFDGVLTWTDGTSMTLPGNANITTAAGDTAIVVSDGSGVWTCMHYTRQATAP